MAEDWKGLSTALGKSGHPVRRVDLWRYLDCCPMELEEFGSAFCEEVRASGSGEDGHVVVGYSMGGRLALHALLAGMRERLFRGAVIVSAHPGLSDEREKILRMAGDAEWAGKALVGEWQTFLQEWDRQPVLNPEGAGLDGLGDRRRLEIRRQAVARSFMDWSLGKQADLRPALGQLDVPVLWVTGERDTKFSKLAAEVVPTLPHGEQTILPESGHRVPWEKPGEFAALVDQFCASGER
jgi:2-succinyl-6-hydroxy-2,4-cyclohexadiene-1-carboxylate synthase